MIRRKNGIGEIIAILALCAVVMIGVIAVISHINKPSGSVVRAASVTGNNVTTTD